MKSHDVTWNSLPTRSPQSGTLGTSWDQSSRTHVAQCQQGAHGQTVPRLRAPQWCPTAHHPWSTQHAVEGVYEGHWLLFEILDCQQQQATSNKRTSNESQKYAQACSEDTHLVKYQTIVNTEIYGKCCKVLTSWRMHNLEWPMTKKIPLTNLSPHTWSTCGKLTSQEVEWVEESQFLCT